MTPLGTEPGSLQGIRVVEIGTSVAAPMATQILGDLGADVIKVERPGPGDDARGWAPPDWDGNSIVFLSLNRNKKSIALDFKQHRGRELLERLVRRADVLVQNLRPGSLATAGFSPERLRELNERLIYCEMTGFGPTGPRAGEPAYDPLLQAYSGIVSITGNDGAPPARVPVSLLDVGTGMWAALAVYEALRRRDRTGRGSHIQVSLLQTALMWLNAPLLGVLGGNPAPERLGSGLASVVPYGAFPTLDGYAFISAGNNGLWQRLCSALDARELAARNDFAENPDRVRHRAEVEEELSRATSRLTTNDLLERLAAARVPSAPVQTLDQVIDDEQVNAIGALSPLEHKEIDNFRVVNLPMTIDGAYPAHSTAPPSLGADSAEVLAALDVSADEIAALVHDGVIQIGTQ